MSRSRNWCFTINNHSAEDCAAVAEWKCRGVAFAEEVGASGTNHVQGYVSFKEAVTLGSVKKVHASAHWEPARGTAAQNLEYIQKGEQSHPEWEEKKTAGPNYGKNLKGFVKVGEFPKDTAEQAEGQRRIWADALIAVRENRLRDLDPMMLATRLRQLQYADIQLRQMEIKPTIWAGDLQHMWFVGPAGSGKTRAAHEEYPGAYIKDPKERWWDGYTGQSTVIIDDVDVYQVAMGGDLKRWGDRYPFQAPVKGGYLLIRPERVVVTSQYEIAEIWDDTATRAALARRYTVRRF